MHAIVEFLMKNPDKAKSWYENSNSVIFLNIDNEQELLNLIDKCKSKNLECYEFREPDLNNSLTAICIEPSNKTKKVCYKLHLALNENIILM